MSEINKRMFIAINTEFGPPSVVRIEEVELPRIQSHEVLIQSKASTVTVADGRLRSKKVPRGFGFMMGLLYGFRKPTYKALGTCVAGEVVAVGSSVHKFQVGDRVVAALGMKFGGHAQFVSFSEKGLVVKIPDSISYQEAAAVLFGGSTALAFLRDKLKIQKGDRLLIIGAGGSVGTAAVQIGKVFGAHVTGVCSTEKVAAVYELGADAVIDYKKTDWRQGSEIFEIILDMVGGTELANSKHKLSSRGKIGLVVADLPTTLRSLWGSAFSSQKMIAGAFSETTEDLEQLMNWLKEGKLNPAIGNQFHFLQIAQAHALIDQGTKFGNTVINFD